MTPVLSLRDTGLLRSNSVFAETFLPRGPLQLGVKRHTESGWRERLIVSNSVQFGEAQAAADLDGVDGRQRTHAVTEIEQRLTVQQHAETLVLAVNLQLEKYHESIGHEITRKVTQSASTPHFSVKGGLENAFVSSTLIDRKAVVSRLPSYAAFIRNGFFRSEWPGEKLKADVESQSAFTHAVILSLRVAIL